MCQAPNHIYKFLPQLQVALFRQKRQLRTAQILDKLRNPARPEWERLSALSFAALAIKLERLIYRAFPENYGLLPDAALDMRMRQVIKRILSVKNNHVQATYQSSVSSN